MNKKQEIKNKKFIHVHFIGIGGIGVSALAQYYLAKGHQVSGSDLVSSEITDLLKGKGAKIYIGKHKKNNVPSDVAKVIYSPAVPSDNIELQQANKFQVSSFKFQVLSYPEALGELTKQYFTIAVCGTHGKSTTSAMLSLAMIKAGLDPTVIIGTKLKEFGDSNFRIGDSKYLIIEADEWQASFLNYWPKIIIITNIEAEHLDYYKDLNHVLITYKEFISHLPKDGVVVANKDDKNAFELTKLSGKLSNSRIYYSLEQSEAKDIKKALFIPGKHNVSNALAVFAVCRYAIRYVKIPEKTIYKALSEYKGSWRRFEIKKIEIDLRENKGEKGRIKELTVVHDYAHHPTEISVTLKAIREKWPKKQIWAVFQPHQYQRTHYLFKDFIKVFKQALRSTQGKLPINKVIITDIYDVAGRETQKIREKTSSKELVKAIKKDSVIYLAKNKIFDYLEQNLQGREVVIVMGAGDIYELFH